MWSGTRAYRFEGMKMEEETGNFSRLILHPSFNSTIAEINRLNIDIPPKPSLVDMDFDPYTYPNDGRLVSSIENDDSYALDPRNGRSVIESNIGVCAYDESLNKFEGLEGTAYLFSHSLVVHGKKDYLPSCFLAFYFYTRSKEYTDDASHIKYSRKPEVDSKLDYVRDRTEFIVGSVPNNSLIFIDGPLIGGQASSYTVKLNDELLGKNVIPLFFVKNSRSNLVTDNVETLRGKYNSDMDWAYKTLRQGERSGFFKYVDRDNPRHAKLFCYMKTFNASPQRVELHTSTFQKHRDDIDGLMDAVYYLMLVQGDLRNPQVRPIAIAEKYARDAIKLVDLSRLMKTLGLTSTVNQERFGW